MQALNANNLDLVTWLCRKTSPSAAATLPQIILLSLVQQLSVDLTRDLDAKLPWLQEALLYLDPFQPSVRESAFGILQQVHASISRALSTAPDNGALKLLRLAVQSLLHRAK
jgi:enhancer of mRNA-decapping protein 4